ncbi:hypothetical protein ACFL1X_10270 [Candidatus Hydrogenedentota bacterium]
MFKFINIILIASAVLMLAVCFAQTEPSPWDADNTLDSITVAERIYKDWPIPKTLSQSELGPILVAWDAAVTPDDLEIRLDALKLIERTVPKYYRFAGSRVIRYDNPEIRGRLIELYMAEHARTITGELSHHMVESEDGACGNVLPDYLDHLAALAYSTFSVDIYDTVLDSYMAGSPTLRHAYLASVYPDTTLKLILETTPGKRDGKVFGSDDILFHSDHLVNFGNIRAGFQLLSTLCDRAPEIIQSERERVLQFVKQHAKHYSVPIRVSYRPEPRPRTKLDYKNRLFALGILDQIATADDVYSIVSDIMEDAPDNPSRHRRNNDVIALGNRIIEKLEREQ